MSLKKVLLSLAIVGEMLTSHAQTISDKTSPQIKEVLQNNTTFVIKSELPNAHKTLRPTNVYSAPNTQSSMLIQIPQNIFVSVVPNTQASKGRKSIICGKQKWRILETDIEKTNTLQVDLKTATNKAIVVDKQHRKIKIYSNFGQKLEREFEIGLWYGVDSLDKTEQADGKTPEWIYYIAAKNANSLFGVDPTAKWKHLGSLMLSYPNEQDALEWYSAGSITKEQYDNILTQIWNKSIPDQTTALGNYIMIHGGGTYTMLGDQKVPDRSHGCITLNDKDQKWLYNFIDEKSTIIVF